MTIPVTCTGCGRKYEVDGSFRGKRGKCAGCGHVLVIPDAESATAAPAAAAAISDEGGYALGDTHEPAQSTFRASPATSIGSPERSRDRGGTRTKTPRRTIAAGGLSRHLRSAKSRRRILISMAVVIPALALSAAFIPGARLVIGIAVALPGLLLCIYGYASGAYIAFTEDDLYGWLYLLFPFYTAYYCISRWDEMRSRLLMVVAGLGLLVLGGRLLERDRAVAVKAEAAAEAAAEPE